MTFSFIFYYLADCRKTGRDRKRSDWLAACDRQTGSSNHLPSSPPPVDNPHSDVKLFGLISHLPVGNHSFPTTTTQKRKRRKQNILFCFCFSCWGAYVSLICESFDGEMTWTARAGCIPSRPRLFGGRGERGVTWPGATPRRTVAPDSFSHMQMSSRWSRTWWNVSRLGGAQEEHGAATAVWLHTVELMIWRHIVGE